MLDSSTTLTRGQKLILSSKHFPFDRFSILFTQYQFYVLTTGPILDFKVTKIRQ